MKATVKRQKIGDKGIIVLSDDSGKETQIIADILVIELEDDDYSGKRILEAWQVNRYYTIAKRMQNLVNIFSNLVDVCEKP